MKKDDFVKLVNNYDSLRKSEKITKESKTEVADRIRKVIHLKGKLDKNGNKVIQLPNYKASLQYKPSYITKVDVVAKLMADKGIDMSEVEETVTTTSISQEKMVELYKSGKITKAELGTMTEEVEKWTIDIRKSK